MMRVTVLCMAVLSTLCGTLGCSREQEGAKHGTAELTAVSISCGHMDRSLSYSFWARRSGESWLFDAECSTDQNQTETVLESQALDADDVNELMTILSRNDSIAYAESYRATKKVLSAVDETTYSFCLTFEDGEQYVTDDRQGELEELFYRIAEKYGE